MRIGAALPPRARASAIRRVRQIEAADDHLPFTADSDLRWMILRMISLNSLSAFATEITRTQPAQPVRGPELAGAVLAATQPAPAQRKLEAVPPQPSGPTPRGSLLDLRV
jgi:type VI protein secretion system component VasA